ncbi:MAG: sensor histidine kinase [Actinomycetota bacterium]|nr:sensor histidine kinase [Actinomycetota bacterium]
MQTLSAQLLAGQIVVLVIAAVVGFLLWAHAVRGQLDHQYEQRALAIAAATAAMPEVVTAVEQRSPRGIEALAERVRHDTGASYVVVIDRTGVRYSHPNPRLIGEAIEEPVVALDGRGHVGIDAGSLGRSANGRAPVVAARGRVVGEVSAGVPETDVSAEAGGQLISLAIYLAVALGVGLLVAVLLARRLKRQTFGLELDEIASLVQEREATLHGIREGVVAVDPDGRISLANDRAHQLLATVAADVGRPIVDVLPDGELCARVFLAPDEMEVTDRLAMHHGRFLVGSRRPVSGAGRSLGYVVTLRDRTELEQALRELDETRSLTDALRAQQHEFSNRMHVMSGLLELGHYDEAMGYANEINSSVAARAAELEAVIDDPRLVALLVAKTTVAGERGVTLTVECGSRISVPEADSDALVTIIGNLVDNAIEAVSDAGPEAGIASAVLVRLASGERDLLIEVHDTGPGIPPGAADSIFTGGWSTKGDDGGRQRGIGLALVRQQLDGLGGRIDVRADEGTQFRVTIPRARDEASR